MIISMLIPWLDGYAQPQSIIRTAPDCATLAARQIDKQANPGAARLVAKCSGKAATYIPSGMRSAPSKIIAVNKITTTETNIGTKTFGGSDINLITGDESFPAVTQAGSMTWGNEDQLVSVYNDTRDNDLSDEISSFSGISVSADGGINFDRLNPNPFETVFKGDIGSPAVAYDKSTGKWLALALTSSCGVQGIGLMSTTTPADPATWIKEDCAHSGPADDRPIIWVDNNAASTSYGRRYISFNDFFCDVQ